MLYIYNKKTVIAANLPFHCVEAVSVVEHLTVGVIAGEGFVNQILLTQQLPLHRRPPWTAAAERSFSMLEPLQCSWLGLVYREYQVCVSE